MVFGEKTVVSDKDSEEKSGKSIGKRLTDTIVKNMEDSTISSVIDALDKIKTTEGTEIGEVHNSPIAFYQFNSEFEYTLGTILAFNVDLLLEIWIQDPIFNTLPIIYKNSLERSFKELALQVWNGRYIKQKFSINFVDGYGSVHMLILLLEPTENSGELIYKMQTLSGGFTPARDWVIVTHTKSNIISSSRTDEIVYLPPVMKIGHINDFIAINQNLLINFYNSLINENL